MSYILTQKQLLAEARTGRNHMCAPLHACIIGGNAYTLHYRNPEERADMLVGQYDRAYDTSYTYPKKPHDSLVDLSSVRIFADNIVLKIGSTTDVMCDGAHPDHLLLHTRCFTDRECQAGDAVALRSDAANLVLHTTIRGFEPPDQPECVLLLNRNIPEQLLQADDLELTLLITHASKEIAEFGSDTGDSRYTVDDHAVKLHSSWHLLEPTCKDDDGNAVTLPVVSADVYVEYRAWLPDMSQNLHTVTTPESLEDIPGELCADNELKWAVELARQNSGIAPVHYIAVTDPDDPAAWVAAVNRIAGNYDVYGIVPLTRDPEALSTLVKHVQQQSKPRNGCERKLWVSPTVDDMAPIADDSNSLDALPLLACVEVDTENTDYVRLTVPGNACFVSLGVRPGDIVRCDYSVDVYGNDHYTEHVVDSIIHEESLRVAANQELDPSATPVRIEVWRTRLADEFVTALEQAAQRYDSPRVCVVWPNRITVSGADCEGWNLCAILAGLRSGIMAHQDMSNVELVGLENISRSGIQFTGDQLELLANAGVFVVTWNTGVIAPHAAVTSARTVDPLHAEESVVANLDSINKLLKYDMDEFFGKMQASTPTAHQLLIRLNQRISTLTNKRVRRLGGQIIAGNVETVRRHSFLPGRIVINASIVVPIPGRHGLPPSDREIRRQVIA